MAANVGRMATIDANPPTAILFSPNCVLIYVDLANGVLNTERVSGTAAF
jgi:hypothetical protein